MIIVLAMLMVLVIGQTALAKGSVGLTVGYTPVLEDGSNWWKQNLGIGISGGYTFDNNLSLNAEFSFIANFNYEETYYAAGLYAKYPVLSSGIFSLAVQSGVSYSYIWDYNVLFASLGLACNVAASEKINVYANIKIPVLAAYLSDEEYGGIKLFKAFYVDAKLGADYTITENINVGLELKASNANAAQVEDDFRDCDCTYWFFSIGAKVGYSF